MDEQTRARLEAQRAEAYENMRAALDESGENGLSAESQEKYDRAEADFDRIDGQLQRAARMRERDRSTAERNGGDPERAAAQEAETRSERFTRALDLAGKSDANRAAFLRGDEYREAFREGVLRGHLDVPEFRAALNLAVDGEGGYTAPPEFVAELLTEAAEFSVIRQYARKITTSHGRDLEFPVLATKGQAGWTSEVLTDAEADALQSEPTFGAPKVLGAHPAQREVVTSRDLLVDSVLDVEALIRELIAESFGELESAAFATGDGNGKPTGIITGLDAANIVTGAAGEVATVTTDELIDVQHKVKRRYRANARWLLNDDSLKAIRKLTDSNGQYVWRAGLSDGEPATILGKPYEVDEYMPDMAANATPIIFGDLSGYWVRDVSTFVVQRLNELYARRRQVGFLASDKRVDGKLMRPERVAAYRNAAV